MRRPLQNLNVNLQRRLVSLLAATFTGDAAFTSVKMPCGAHVYASVSVLTAVASPLVQVGSRVLYGTAAPANKLHYLGYFEAGEVLVPAVGALGSVTIYGRGNMGVPTKIAGSAVWSSSAWRAAGDWGAGA